MKLQLSRRQFLKTTTITAAGLGLGAPALSFAQGSPNGKLNCGFVGVAHRGGADLHGVAQYTDLVNVVALCDVDDRFLAKAKQAFPKAAGYNDFRRLLDRNDLDAVVVGTPDHTHAVAAYGALTTGRHVYCEKPLTHTVGETRQVTNAAIEHKRVTQIGTQIHALDNYRRVVELVQTGAVGPIREVHVWVNVTYGGMNLPTEHPPVPDYLHYNLWVGPVHYRYYSPAWVPQKWRNWWAFGGGTLADFGCHYMDLPFWALDLRYPLSIDPVAGPPVHPQSVCPWVIVRYQYPARPGKGGTAGLPPVTLTWYHGGRHPGPEILPAELYPHWKSGVLFVGEKGKVLSDYTRHMLLPEKQFAGFQPPTPYIPKSIGHHKEWVVACLTGGPTTCRFEYSGPLTEAALLGNVAYRVGKKLDWDWKALRATNAPEAEQYLQPHYREGWSLG